MRSQSGDTRDRREMPISPSSSAKSPDGSVSRQRTRTIAQMESTAALEMHVDERTGQTELISPEDANLMEEFEKLNAETHTLLTRVESRKVGYNAFKQAKKKASALKNSFKFGLREITSVLTTGKHADHKTKLDELNEITADLLERNDNLMSICTARAEVSLDIQASLMEQSESYITRLKACLRHNHSLSEDIKVVTNTVYELLSDVNVAMIGLQNMNDFHKATLELASVKRKPSPAAYIPWAMRTDHEEEVVKTAEALAEEKKKKEKAEENARLDGELLKEMQRRITALQDVSHECNVSIKNWNKQRGIIETTVANLSEAMILLNECKNKLNNFGDNEAECAVDFSGYDHSQCSDCSIVPGIVKTTVGQLLAANLKANSNTEQVNNLLMNSAQLRSAKEELGGFNTSGDHPQSYQGGVAGPAHSRPMSPGVHKQSSFDDSRGLAANVT